MNIDDQIIDQIKTRTEIGILRYGGTVDRKDIPPNQWRNHLQEELIDALKYNQRCINDENAEKAEWIRGELDELLVIMGELEDKTQSVDLIGLHYRKLETRLKELEGKS